jgi:hypothetical protein
MPAFAAGMDYAVWAKPDGTLQATGDHVNPPVAKSRKIGGFHYAPGSNAAGSAGGDSTPQINQYSIWDLKWRPACADPRGMTLVSGGFWADIYLLNTEHNVNGTSKYNVLIADGSSPPKVPTAFGGDGSAVYGNLDWWAANEILKAHGKRSPTYAEYSALAFGTTEKSSCGTDPGNTILQAAYTSKWGAIQSSGCLWIWTNDFSYRPGANPGFKWRPDPVTPLGHTHGRGDLYLENNEGVVAALAGGLWSDGANSGSRASYWITCPWHSGDSIGARGVCDHLNLV